MQRPHQQNRKLNLFSKILPFMLLGMLNPGVQVESHYPPIPRREKQCLKCGRKHKQRGAFCCKEHHHAFMQEKKDAHRIRA